MKPRSSSSPRSSSLAAVARSLAATALLMLAPAARAPQPSGPARPDSREAELRPASAPRSRPAFSSLGAGFAVAKVGTAAIGALAEKPELFGRLLIFVGLAEGIAIYGLIVSILILNRLGVMADPLLHRRRSQRAPASVLPARASSCRAVGEEAAALAAACGQAHAGAASAPQSHRGIDEAALVRALAALSPLILLVPDPAGEAPLPDLAARLRAPARARGVT